MIGTIMCAKHATRSACDARFSPAAYHIFPPALRHHTPPQYVVLVIMLQQAQYASQVKRLTGDAGDIERYLPGGFPSNLPCWAEILIVLHRLESP